MPKDINGNDVIVGSKVKVLSIDPSLINSLPNDELTDVKSMVGEIYEVLDITGEYALVEKWWNRGNGYSKSHSLSLSSKEMELVNDNCASS